MNVNNLRRYRGDYGIISQPFSSLLNMNVNDLTRYCGYYGIILRSDSSSSLDSELLMFVIVELFFLFTYLFIIGVCELILLQLTWKCTADVFCACVHACACVCERIYSREYGSEARSRPPSKDSHGV